MKQILCNYLFLIIFAAFTGAVKFRCDYSFVKIGWIKYHEMPVTWSDARLICQSEGAMLASPTSHELLTAMKKSVRHIDIFTGFSATSSGSFYSIDGIALHSFPLLWATNEPDNKDNAENCISMNSKGKLADVRCDTPRPYMCFRHNSLQTTNICGTPDPEYRLEIRTNKCYKFHTTKREFKRAHLVCSAEGGHLAIINSETESQVIRDIFANYPAHKILGDTTSKNIAFIGFHNYGEGADWRTIHGQTLQEAGFDRFDQGQPDNATTGEYCGSVWRSGLLNDYYCEEHIAFICEKDATSPPVCDNNHNNNDLFLSQGFTLVDYNK